MKTILALSAAILFSAIQSRAGILAGPITNPANGHDYYLLSQNSWTASEAEAESLGGTLATIRNAAEQEWVLGKFGAYGDTNRNLWLGLHRTYAGGLFVWASGETSDYSNWEPGQPDNNGGHENYVHMFGKIKNRTPGTWNDLADIISIDDGPNCGVVEVPGASNEEALSDKEKKLVGKWYENGNGSRPSYIAATQNLLFMVGSYGRGGRIIYDPAGYVIASTLHLRGELVQDKILWSDGTWWSRTPSKYQTNSSYPAPMFNGVIPD